MVSEARAREGLALSASIADNIALPKLELFGRCGLVPRRRVAVAAQRWIDALGIRASSPHQRTGSLSGGNQQRVALARLLHADTDVLLLDEPTRGVDVAARAALYRWIDACAAGTAEALGEPGKPGALDRPGGRPRAVLVASSYLPELLGLCDRIAVMQRGVLGPAVDAASLDEHTLLRLATGAQPSP